MVVRHGRAKSIGLALAILALSLCGCARSPETASPIAQTAPAGEEESASHWLVAVEDEPDTVDFQCTTIHYTVAANVFDRLVEMKAGADGSVTVMPSLAESWEESDDGLVYAFHLREDIEFSNGASLTASDVLYTFTRLLTHPDSCNRDIALGIAGAEALISGKARQLEGLQVLNDTDFTITLEEPFEAFLACLSMPGASILDEETTRAAGDRFGKAPECTVGTGPFILRQWTPGEGMLLSANPDCWSGAPNCDGLDLRFMTEPEDERAMFESGKLDLLDLDELGDTAEYFIRGDIYQDRLYQVQPIGITYIALNESIEPLDDVRVRKALQMALNRKTLLDAVHSGRGNIENGIFPRGLYGCNPELPEIACDADAAKALLAQAGYPDGFDLAISVKSSSVQWERTLMNIVASMWKDIGVRPTVAVMDEGEFMRRRKSGALACYTATWTADFNDPDNFIYTFFGSGENTDFRSLCYPDESVMARVRKARAIRDPDERIREYRDLEQTIVQRDAAWIPLFSRLRYYVISERVEGLRSAWNGSVKNEYRSISIK